MKIGYFCIRGSIPWLLNWESKENQLDGAVRSGHTIWAPPVKPKGKAADRNILFWHFWNMQYLIFYCNCSFFDFILKATLGHPRVKNMLNAEFRESVEDFHPWNCINGTKSREASQMIVVVFFHWPCKWRKTFKWCPWCDMNVLCKFSLGRVFYGNLP